MSLKHWLSTDPRNPCTRASDPNSTGSSEARHVTCPLCRAAIRSFDRACDETVKDAPAVRRREVVTP